MLFARRGAVHPRRPRWIRFASSLPKGRRGCFRPILAHQLDVDALDQRAKAASRATPVSRPLSLSLVTNCIVFPLGSPCRAMPEVAGGGAARKSRAVASMTRIASSAPNWFFVKPSADVRAVVRRPCDAIGRCLLRTQERAREAVLQRRTEPARLPARRTGSVLCSIFA